MKSHFYAYQVNLRTNMLLSVFSSQIIESGHKLLWFNNCIQNYMFSAITCIRQSVARHFLSILFRVEEFTGNQIPVHSITTNYL